MENASGKVCGPKKAKGPDVYLLIRRAITRGRFVPGQRLRERELADQYGVSRTPIREAFQHLIQEGLVVYEPHRGGRIVPLSEELAQQILVVREPLEGLAARLAAQKDPRGTAVAMRKTISRARRAYQEGQLSELISANQDFHQIMVEKSGNALLIAMYRMLQGYLGLMMSISLSWPRRPAETIQSMERSSGPSKAEKPMPRRRPSGNIFAAPMMGFSGTLSSTWSGDLNRRVRGKEQGS